LLALPGASTAATAASATLLSYFAANRRISRRQATSCPCEPRNPTVSFRQPPCQPSRRRSWRTWQEPGVPFQEAKVSCAWSVQLHPLVLRASTANPRHTPIVACIFVKLVVPA